MKMPKNLSRGEQSLFREAVKALDADLIESDAWAVECFVRHLARWRRLVAAEAAAADRGEDVLRMSGPISSAWKALESSLKQLTLTPASRKTGSGGVSGKLVKDNPLMKMIRERN